MERMGALSNNLKAVVKLQTSKGNDLQQPLFQSLSSVRFGKYILYWDMWLFDLWLGISVSTNEVTKP